MYHNPNGHCPHSNHLPQVHYHRTRKHRFTSHKFSTPTSGQISCPSTRPNHTASGNHFLATHTTTKQPSWVARTMKVAVPCTNKRVRRVCYLAANCKTETLVHNKHSPIHTCSVNITQSQFVSYAKVTALASFSNYPNNVWFVSGLGGRT